MNNKFTVEATGAKKLNVRVKIIVWVTKSSEASGNTAIVSQSSVPSGTYQIKIDGDAGEGVSKVKLRIIAFQGIKANSGGEFTYSYSTKSIPSGDFDIKVGGITKTVTIKSEKNSGSISDSSSKESVSKDSISTDSSSINSSSNKTSSNETSSNETASNKTASNETSSNGTASKETSSSSFSATEKQSPVNSEKSKETEEKQNSEVVTQDENLVEKGNNTQLSGKNVPDSESSGQFTNKLYLLAGMGAGLLILIIYARRK